MGLRRLLLIYAACCLIGLGIPFPVGYTYTDRLASRPSMYQVVVPDRVPAPLAAAVPRPRRTVVVVLDGLGYNEALTMGAARFLRDRGQCRKTDVGSLPMSRPVYAVLSTGVEQDRGGPLTNDATGPAGAESIWDIARAAGRVVAAVSELPWWRDLFPRGFTSYQMAPREADFFRLAPPAELLLVHPLYIDETGHLEGAASPEYGAAVARADRELQGFLSTLDLDRDLVVLTADHGHSLGGGHGGHQDRVEQVLTCFAGFGVQRRPELGELRMTSVGPALTLLLGLHFPNQMRAGDDNLDALWEIIDAKTYPAAYLADRRAAVERFRAANRAQVKSWLPATGGSWKSFYAAALRQHATGVAAVLLVLLVVLLLHQRGHRAIHHGHRGQKGFRFGVLWLLCCVVAAVALQAGLRGSFDMSSVNYRESFIRFTSALGFGVGVAAFGLHLAVRRSQRALLWDMSILSLVGTILCVAQPALYGWRVGFPVPPPAAFFLPYFAALFLSALNGTSLLFCMGLLIRKRLRS